MHVQHVYVNLCSKRFFTQNFNFRRSPGRLDRISLHEVRLKVMQKVFDMRARRKFDAAARLEELCDEQLRSN